MRPVGRLWGRGIAWQRYSEMCTSSIRDDFDGAIVQLDEFPCDRKSQSCTLDGAACTRASLIEGIEDSDPFILVDAGAFVLDIDDGVILPTGQRYGDTA